MFRTVSIIPGIDAAAPDRALKSNGGPETEHPARNKLFPLFRSKSPNPRKVSTHSAFRANPSSLSNFSHAVVAIVNPGGTLSPGVALISCKPEPFDPSSSSQDLSPSASPPPNA
jgi:hypothetical protein